MTPRFSPERERSGSALCLSGGGFRAALFHLGALRRLNEVGLLSRMTTISSVSGGSVANGLLAKVWRDLVPKIDGVFENFETVYESRLRAFCAHDIRTGILVSDRLNPLNWLSLAGDDHSATDFLSDTYQDELVGDLRMKDLAEIKAAGGPDFVFDASNLQTGVNFVFSGDRVGDYQIGYTRADEILVADAIAASSAFPMAFPPLVLRFGSGAFVGGMLGGADVSASDLEKMRRRVVLTDGGVYDNLGLEPVWKRHRLVFCSDGGKPFSIDAAPGTVLASRLLRCQDVIGNQALAIRKRWLIDSLDRGIYAGTYWGIATRIDHYPTHGPGYLGEALARLREVRTDFDTFDEQEQLVLMNHGWCLTDAALRSHVSEALPAIIPDGVIPDADLLATPACVAALKDSDKTKPLGR